MVGRIGRLLFVLLLLIGIILQPVIATDELVNSLPEHVGPFVNKIDYQIISQDDQQVLALEDDEIDMIGDFIDPAFLGTFESDIRVANTLRNGYGYFTINCAKYPLNITAFRRAFAFALDKERISDEVWDGLSTPLDSFVPVINPFSIEGQLSYDYYSANPDFANQLLDEAGFLDIDDDEYREAPDGSDFGIIIKDSVPTNIAIDTCNIAKEALESLHVDVTYAPTDFWEYPPAYQTPSYDIAFLGTSFNDFDVDWLAYEYWSENAEYQYQNYPRWKNATYDSWREQLLHSISFGQVYEAAAEMQKILVYECPAVICYENIYLTAYRWDRFTGFVNDVNKGVPCWWTNYRVHLLDDLGGPFGGTLRWSSTLDVDTFNFMQSNSAYTLNVLQMLYDSLLRQDSGGHDLPWLVDSYSIETHQDNTNVPEGHTRLTFEILHNITWTDGMPLTGDDVAFSLNYYHDAPGNPYGRDLGEMIVAYAPNPYRVIVEFGNESFWFLHTVGYKSIIPKHVFEEVGIENWNSWNPNPPNEVMVTSGPFNISDYEPGERIELTRNANYFRVPQTDDLSDTSDTNPDNPSDVMFGIPLIHIFVTIPSIVVIVLIGIKWKLETGTQYVHLIGDMGKHHSLFDFRV
ncbi:MAG: ABC transporter substrate-binding protein [Candidatus Thorarchaeota archaeon]